jgi:hypothetical protein
MTEADDPGAGITGLGEMLGRLPHQVDDGRDPPDLLTQSERIGGNLLLPLVSRDTTSIEARFRGHMRKSAVSAMAALPMPEPTG